MHVEDVAHVQLKNIINLILLETLYYIKKNIIYNFNIIYNSCKNIH